MSRILIIGGGIGGLTAGVALRRRGFEATVYEAAPELQPVGKGIWVPTNAMQVLHRLGLADAVVKAGWPLERIQLRTVAGALLLDGDLREVAAKYGHTTVSIHRAALVRLLADALPPGALRLGKRCTSVEHDGAGVGVRFADGTEARGDLLVAADGIRSAVREQVLPGVPLRYSGLTCYRGIADLELPADLAHVCWEVWGGPVRFGFSPVGLRQVYWFAPVTAPADSPLSSGEALTALLAGQYAKFPGPVPEILRHTPAEEIIRTDLYDFAPIGRWSSGRVVLLGDAAHAMTPNLGQGGAQAVEDAYVLADRLAGCATVDEALREYERLRLPKVRWVVNTAWRFGRLAHLRGRWPQRLRDLVLKWMAGRSEKQFDRLYALNY
jgi:2-polyprenyl-6-methoxyphenol hydroxylase-like FAD-dependent oxidoreductase